MLGPVERVEADAASALPFVKIPAVGGFVLPLSVAEAELDVEEVDAGLHVVASVEARHLEHAEPVSRRIQFVDGKCGLVRPFLGPAAGDFVVVSPFHEYGARRDHREQQIGVHRQPVLPSGEIAQLRDEPVGEHARGAFDAFAPVAFAGISPRHEAADPGAACHESRYALVARGRYGHHLAVAGVAVDRDSVHVYLRNRLEIVEHYGHQPCAAGEFGEVVVRIQFREVRAVVHEVAAGESGGDVSAAQKHVALAVQSG